MQIELDYPSHQRGDLGPPVPVLLDTCLLQHLGYVMAFGEECWVSEGVPEINDRFPPVLATELLSLGDILQHYRNGDGPPWAVSRISRIEFAQAPVHRQDELFRTWVDWADYWEGLASHVRELNGLAEIAGDRKPPIDPGQLQLPLGHVAERPLTAPLFGPFADEGDRALIMEARRLGFPAILTTDLRSLWRHRRWLYPFGVELWRPSDVLRAAGYRIPSVP